RKYQIGGFACQIGRRSHGDAYIRPGESGAVIQAVADHRHRAAAWSALIESRARPRRAQALSLQPMKTTEWPLAAITSARSTRAGGSCQPSSCIHAAVPDATNSPSTTPRK